MILCDGHGDGNEQTLILAGMGTGMAITSAEMAGYYYDLLRQLAAQILKKHTYIKLQQEINTKSKYSHTHAITRNYKHSEKNYCIQQA